MKIAMIIAAGAVLFATAASAQPVDRRQAYQQARIDRGVATGRLTPREADRLQRQQNRIARSEARMRYRNGGHLTRYQRARLHHRQALASRNIHRKAHNYRRY